MTAKDNEVSLRAAMDACHEALGEHPGSDDATLAEGIKMRLDDLHAEVERLTKVNGCMHEIEKERDRYHDALIARHGGEPVALLSELDEARSEIARLRALVREAMESVRSCPKSGHGFVTAKLMKEIASWPPT